MKAGNWHTPEIPARPAGRFKALLFVFGVSIAFCDLLFYSVNLDLLAGCAVGLLASICLLLKGAELLWKRQGRDSVARRAGAYAIAAWRLTNRLLLFGAVGASLVFICDFLSGIYEIYIPLILLLFVQLVLRLGELWLPRDEAHRLARLTVAWRVRAHHGTQLIVAIIAYIVLLYAGCLCAMAGIWTAGNVLSAHLLGFPYHRLLRMVGLKKRQTPWPVERDRLREAFYTLLIPLFAWMKAFVQSRVADHLMGKYGREFFLETEI